MGFFRKIFKKEEDSTKLSVEEKKTKLDLRKKQVGVCLEKKEVANPLARVCLVMDMSYSMEELYQNGTVQSLVERVLPIALQMDDNGELDMWLFSDRYKRLPSVTEKDFGNYVNNIVLKKENEIWGGTSFYPVMDDIVRRYKKQEPSDIPTFVIFITDGETMDTEEIEELLVECSGDNIFWQYVGIGDEKFKFLKKLDELEGRVVDNANFLNYNNIAALSDAELYEGLLTEYPEWLKKINLNNH